MEFRESPLEDMVEMHKNYFGKKVFLTGHTGFKGSWFLILLKKIGAIVKGYSLEQENQLSLFHEIDGNSLCESFTGNINNFSTLKQELLDFQPDFIFHFAAQALVNESYKDPINTFNTNIMGTVNLLSSLKLLKKKCTVVIVTTDKVYKNKESLKPYSESDELGGYDPYSSSKACVELISNSYINSFFNLNNYSIHKKSIGIARAGNVIGGGDWSNDRLMKDIIISIIKNKPVKLRYPNSIRPWQHVLEVLNAYLILGSYLNKSPSKNLSYAYNFGPSMEDCIPVKVFTEKVINRWGSKINISEAKEKKEHESGILLLQTNKAKKILNWKPMINIEIAIKYSVDWYKGFYLDNDFNALNECLKQINNFYK